MRRLLLIGTFVSVLATVLIGGHIYLAQRLVVDPAVRQPFSGVLLGVIALGGLLLALQPLTERAAPPSVARAVAWPASIWMGFAFFSLMLLLVSDVSWLLLGAHTDNGTFARVATVRAFAVLGLAGSASAIGIRSAIAGPALHRVDIALARWPRALDGFRIVQLSDLHFGPILDRRFAVDLVTRCNALDPDLIAITGDLVDGSVERLAGEVAPLRHLRARHGVFFVTGNHDYYSGVDPWVAHVATLGFRVLRNQAVTIGSGAAAFTLAGVEDHHAHLVSATHREDLPGALAGRDPTRPVILLAHDPATFVAAARQDVDLQLSGHTHGGQIWPFRYFVRLSTPYVGGYYRTPSSQLHVSLGTGFWGPAMRFRAPAEITEITIRGTDTAAG